MNVLYFVIVVFAVSFIVHLIYWKIRLPEKQTLALIKIFYSMWIAAGIGLLLTSGNALLLGHSFIVYSSLVAAYIITYSALEADSPSLLIIKKVFEAGEKGLEPIELKSFLNDDRLIRPRLKDLVRDDLARIEDDRYFITSNGRTFIKLFISFRNLLGLSKGG